MAEPEQAVDCEFAAVAEAELVVGCVVGLTPGVVRVADGVLPVGVQRAGGGGPGVAVADDGVVVEGGQRGVGVGGVPGEGGVVDGGELAEGVDGLRIVPSNGAVRPSIMAT